MNLFQSGSVVLHSGGNSKFKIECDALTDEDIKTLAEVIASKYEFSAVYGIFRGGMRLATALQDHITPVMEVENRHGDHWANNKDFNIPTILIVDDVLTTGKSFLLARKHVEEDIGWSGNVQGICIFARDPRMKPDWVESVFDMNIQV